MVKRVRFNLKQLMEKTTTATTTTMTITTTTTEPRPDASTYGRILPLLRQGWMVKQKIMHYGLFEQCLSEYNCSQGCHSGILPTTANDLCN